jgi:hypothetical protein
MTNNKQQTAVEWYANQLHRVVSNTTDALTYNHKELLEQAKEMEMEQKANTWNNAINAVEKDKWESFEQYYNETYGGNK